MNLISKSFKLLKTLTSVVLDSLIIAFSVPFIVSENYINNKKLNNSDKNFNNEINKKIKKYIERKN